MARPNATLVRQMQVTRPARVGKPRKKAQAKNARAPYPPPRCESSNPMYEEMQNAISDLLQAQTWAVVGASTNPEKYGYLVYKSLKAAGKTAYPVNPRAQTIDNDPCYPDVAALPAVPDAAVAIIPPALTEKLIPALAQAGIRKLWLQPGAESPAAVAAAREHHITLVHGNPCLMVALRTHRKG